MFGKTLLKDKFGKSYPQGIIVLWMRSDSLNTKIDHLFKKKTQLIQWSVTYIHNKNTCRLMCMDITNSNWYSNPRWSDRRFSEQENTRFRVITQGKYWHVLNIDNYRLWSQGMNMHRSLPGQSQFVCLIYLTKDLKVIWTANVGLLRISKM